MRRIIGIDLGTTNSAVGYVGEDGLPSLIRNRDGDVLTPSVVLFDGDEATVGKQAKNAERLYPLDVASLAKRHMGDTSFVFIPESGDTQFPAEAISSYILRYLADCAGDFFGQAVNDVVITVPAYFGEAERTATMQAGQIAGLNVVQLINEPTAAAISYGFVRNLHGNIVVYDLGGGTFDVTAMRVDGNEYVVLATGGDKRLGGFDFDNALAEITLEKFSALGGSVDQYDDNFAAELRARVEEAKVRLSQVDSARIHLSHGGVNGKISIHRNEFERAIEHLVVRTRYMLDDVLSQANLAYSDIDHFLLVGGSTRVPIVRDSVRNWTGSLPNLSINPDEAVALGAGIVAASSAVGRADSRGTAEVSIRDVISVGLGVAVMDPNGSGLINSLVVNPGTQIPCRVRANSFRTVSETNMIHFQVTEGDEDGVDVKYVNVKAETKVRLSSNLPEGHPLEVMIIATGDGQIEAELFDGVSGRRLCQVPVRDKRSLSDDEVNRLRRATDRIALT